MFNKQMAVVLGTVLCSIAVTRFFLIAHHSIEPKVYWEHHAVDVPNILADEGSIEAYKYSYYPKAYHKAFAYSKDGPYGFCFNKTTAADARQCALDYCESYRREKLAPCEIISIDGKIMAGAQWGLLSSTTTVRCNTNMTQSMGCTGHEVGGQVVEMSAQDCAAHCSSLTSATCAQWYGRGFCNCADGSVTPNPQPYQFASSCSQNR